MRIVTSERQAPGRGSSQPDSPPIGQACRFGLVACGPARPTAAILTRLSATLWTLEMPSRSRRWDPTGIRDTVDNVVVTLAEQFGWTLEPIHG